MPFVPAQVDVVLLALGGNATRDARTQCETAENVVSISLIGSELDNTNLPGRQRL